MDSKLDTVFRPVHYHFLSTGLAGFSDRMLVREAETSLDSLANLKIR